MNWSCRGRAGRRQRLGRRAAGGLVLALVAAGLQSPGQPPLAAAAASATVPSVPATTTGVDVSYPQCAGSATEALPPSVGFAVVGVNGGKPGTQNPCLDAELDWARASATGAGSPPIGLYLNTADPGNTVGGGAFADWPSSGSTPYGTCVATSAVPGGGTGPVGQDSPACAFEYGEQQARQSFTDASQAISEANLTATTQPIGTAGSLPWWLDVETANTWQTGGTGVAMNVADISGFVAGLRSAGATAAIGIYSYHSAWEQITGGASFGSGAPDWVPGSASEGDAAALCGATGFSGSSIQLAQYPKTYRGETLDGDVACLTAPGYRLAASDGGIFAFGDAPFEGSMGGQPLNEPIVGLASTLSGNGYWEVASDGGIFSFGDAAFHGSMGGQPLNAPIVGMAPDPATGGYWEVATDGGIFSFGAPFYGSMGGQPLNAPIVGLAVTSTGGGYWLVASDGGIFSFGNAAFHGSMGGQPLNAPIVGMAPDPATGGYWEVASDGGIFSFDAPFEGSMGGQPLNEPIVGLASTLSGNGYWEVASDGGIFSFGDAAFEGSMGGQPLNAPIVGMGTA